jgi:prevent-host-death family protein
MENSGISVYSGIGLSEVPHGSPPRDIKSVSEGIRPLFHVAKRQALTITNHGRDELVILDAQEYERLRRLDAASRDEQQRHE